MRIALDACSCIHLAATGTLGDLLRSHEVLLPEESFVEVVRGEEAGHPDAKVVRELRENGSLVIAPSDEAKAGKIRETHALGAGEAAAIQLCLAGLSEAVASDNRRARRVARTMGIAVFGTPELIVGLAVSGKVGREKARTALVELRRRGAFLPQVIEEALREIG